MALLQPILSARQIGKTIAMFTFIEGLNRSCQIEDMVSLLMKKMTLLVIV